MRKSIVAIAASFALLVSLSTLSVAQPPSDVRLTHDAAAGAYVSDYTLATGNAYTDPTLDECSVSRGRQNEPDIAVDPRNTQVLVGSSNDYCGVFAPPGDPTTGDPSGPLWTGYYRSENGGSSFVSSLVPGYPGDVSPFASLAHTDTDSAGDPVIAWDAHGRLFMGAEADTGANDSNGDQWVARFVNSGGGSINDGKLYQGTTTVANGSQAGFLLGKFNDKTALEVDRTGGAYDGNVYFAEARFTGGKISNIYFTRSTDHGVTFSHLKNLTPSNGNLQDPQISVTGNGDVYVTFDTFSMKNGQPFGLYVAKSTNGGATFSSPRLITTYLPVDVHDQYVSGGEARDCGDLSNECVSGYTFFRQTTALRARADQYDADHEWIYLVYGAIKPGTEVDTGTTFGVESGSATGGQEAAYFVLYDGVTGQHTDPMLLADESVGHQVFPDISADGGVLHAEWWDSRNDPTYSPVRPIGNDAAGNTVASLDVFASRSTDNGDTWSTPEQLNAVASNPNYEQFANRTDPFAGDYLFVTSMGGFAFSTWTDWRNVVAGGDQREEGDGDNDSADVHQCRAFDTATSTWGPDTCPHAGGLDQNIYGAPSP
jgi:hypothetical protein